MRFWITSGIALCCLAATSPTQAQSLRIVSPAGPIVVPAGVTGINPGSKPRLRLLEISDRWKFVNSSSWLEPGCSAYAGSKFIITGRGGLPPSPREALRTDAVRVDLGTPIQGEENRVRAAFASNPTRVSAPTQIVEANRWMINDKGEVVLTATASTATLDIPWVPKSGCNAPKPKS